MPDKEKVIEAIENCIGQPKCRDCPWEDCEVEHEVVNSVPYGLLRDALALLKEQEEKIRQLESMNVSASGNGTAIGVVKGGLVIQKGQNNKHIVNNGTMTMTFGK